MKEIVIVGRTGDPQPGMTLKWTKAGRKIVIDSYKEEKAITAAEEIKKILKEHVRIEGADNESRSSRRRFPGKC